MKLLHLGAFMLLGSASALTLPELAEGQAAYAASSAPPSKTPSQNASASSTGQLEEIVITAQRREETTQKSSLAIQVVSAESFARAGITQPQDLNTVIPALQLGSAGTVAQPYIRGVGNADNNGLQVSGVSFNVDGAYVAQPTAYGGSLFDIQRVEVLLGPQGTLYGRGSTGGALNFITREPTSEFGGYLDVDGNNYGLARVSGAVNAPIANDVALRVAGFVDDRKGYYDDGSGDDKSEGIRLRLKINTDALSVLTNLEFTHLGGVGAGSAVITSSSNPRAGSTSYGLPAPWEGPQGPISLGTNASTAPLAGNVNGPIPFPPFGPYGPATARAYLNQNDFSFSTQFDVPIDDHFTFTLIPNYRSVDLKSLNYSTEGLSIYTTPQKSREETVEARLSFIDTHLKWVGGLYYYNENVPDVAGVNAYNSAALGGPPNFFANFQFPTYRTKSLAGFTQGTYSVLSNLRLIGGVRYTSDKQNAMGTLSNFVTVGLPPNFPPFDIVNGAFQLSPSTKSNSTDYKLGAEFDISPDNMLYVTYATGYHPGGAFPAANPANVPNGNTYLPEKLKAAEVGSKNQFFNHTLQVNVEGFYWNYSNKQETFTGVDAIGIPDNITKNAAAAKIKGVDVDLVWQPSHDDRVNGSVEYLDAKYGKFIYTTIGPAPPACVGTFTGTLNGGAPGPANPPLFSANCSGNEMPRAPHWAGQAGYTHTFHPAFGGTIDLTGNVNFASARWLSVNYESNEYAPSFAEGNIFLGYTEANNHWSITGYVRNLSNAAVPTNAVTNSFNSNISYASLNPPRTYGGQIHYNF